MYYYNGFYFWGMNIIWWFIWVVLLIWIFIVPYPIPFERIKKDSPLDILKNRFASGQITKEEYLEHKKILEDDSAKETKKG